MPEEVRAEAVNNILDHVLHELRRALSQPIFRIHKGGIAPLHEYALEHGWFAPSRHGGAFLDLTDAGLKVLAEDQCRRGLPA